MDKKISSKMKKGIKAIESISDLKFTGKTFEDAQDFLSKNLGLLDGVDFRSKKEPSEKQMKGIKLIKDILGIEFEGHTMLDASEFLDEHYEKAINQLNKRGKKNGKT